MTRTSCDDISGVMLLVLSASKDMPDVLVSEQAISSKRSAIFFISAPFCVSYKTLQNEESVALRFQDKLLQLAVFPIGLPRELAKKRILISYVS